MNIMLTPDLENSVLRSCSDLIATNDFYLEKRSAYEVYLLSEKCGIRIMAGISPIGEEQIEFDFFDPRIKDNRRKYYSHTFLLYLDKRSEKRDVLRECPEIKGTFEETLADALKCRATHSIKYRQDILAGDFETWRPENSH